MTLQTFWSGAVFTKQLVALYSPWLCNLSSPGRLLLQPCGFVTTMHYWSNYFSFHVVKKFPALPCTFWRRLVDLCVHVANYPLTLIRFLQEGRCSETYCCVKSTTLRHVSVYVLCSRFLPQNVCSSTSCSAVKSEPPQVGFPESLKPCNLLLRTIRDPAISLLGELAASQLVTS